MEWLRELFETNRIIVLSVYGQVFFVLGLAIALQSRKRSELALARALPWLAAFGIVHGFVEWGYLFIPIQSGYLPSGMIELLLWAQLLLRGLSFALLLQFGAELLLGARPAEAGPPRSGPFGQPWLRLAPALVLVLWGVATVSLSATVAAGYTSDAATWLQNGAIEQAVASVGAPLAVGDVTARLLLALPGAVAAAVGLLRSTTALGTLASPTIGTALRLAAASFAVYAVVGGTIGMPAPFPPSSIVSSHSIIEAIGVPIEVFRSLTGLAMALAIIRSLDLFEQETDRALADARRGELLLRERERIGRDLHDGIIQSIYAAGLHLEEASAGLSPGETPVRGRLETVLSELNRIIGDIRSYIFDLRSGDVATRDAEEIVTGVAEELRANTLIALDLRSEGEYRPRLTAEQAEHLRQIVTEGFSNVLRHARARTVRVRIACGPERLSVEIADDGIGYDPGEATALGRRGTAHGLENMRRRAELVGGTLEAWSAHGQGARLSLTMPVLTTARNAP